MGVVPHQPIHFFFRLPLVGMLQGERMEVWIKGSLKTLPRVEEVRCR
jgi:hypothetical protein